jgi:hypothetical protein
MAPSALASISRLLSNHDPQRDPRRGEGAATSRNVELLLRDPRRNPLLEGVRCASIRGRFAGRRFHRAFIGLRRSSVRRLYPRRTTRGGFDYLCLADGSRIRVGYPSARLRRALSPRTVRRIQDRAVLILTSSRFQGQNRIRAGTSAGSVRRRLRGEWVIRSGRVTFYVGRGRRSRPVFRATRGRVREVGIAARSLTRSRRAATLLLRSWRG